MKSFSLIRAGFFIASLVFCPLHLPAATTDYSTAIDRLRAEAKSEMATWDITGIAIALVDDQETVWAEGFGVVRGDSIFRCGSISKVFNAVAVAQLAEQGKLDLDAPMESFGPGLLPVNPFETNGPVTLRQLLCHRSGMIREAPVGGYFDDSEPGLDGLLKSVVSCVLVNPPNTKTRYSNVAPSIAGKVVELVSGMSYDRYQRQFILGPLDMNRSAWRLRDVPRGSLAPARMRVADGQGGFHTIAAPVFDFGILPAGNLFTTVGDLARFISMLAANGKDHNGNQVLEPETLAKMFTPQLTSDTTGFGLGFSVGKFGEHKSVGHSGAVYGFSSSLSFLPGPKLGVVVLGNEDIVNARIQHLADLALNLMLEAKTGAKAPAVPPPVTLAREDLAALAGDYESQSYWAKLEVQGDRLVGSVSGQRVNFVPLAPTRFRADARIYDGVTGNFKRDGAGPASGFSIGAQTFVRVPEHPAPLPEAWRAYLGSYGPAFIPLVVSERHGHLYAMTENMVDYRLRPINRHSFGMPPGMYFDEQLVFLGHKASAPPAVSLAGMVLKRR